MIRQRGIPAVCDSDKRNRVKLWQSSSPAQTPAIGPPKRTDPLANKKRSTQPEISLLKPANRQEGAFSLEPDSDDDILMDTSGNDPSGNNQTKTLLALRKSYKANLAWTISHLESMKTCTDIRQIPKGQRVTTKCHTLLKDMSNVETRFTDMSTGNSSTT
jgi:hypothetical protein